MLKFLLNVDGKYWPVRETETIFLMIKGLWMAGDTSVSEPFFLSLVILINILSNFR